MIFIVGTYREQNNRILALKLYDSKTKEIGMYHKEKVIQSVEQNKFDVAGINLKVEQKGMQKVKVYSVCTWQTYNVKMLDQVNSLGEPIDDRHVRVPIATKGFGETMEITLVDSMGQEEVVNCDALMELIKSRKVTGVVQKANKTLVFNRWCERSGISNK